LGQFGNSAYSSLHVRVCCDDFPSVTADQPNRWSAWWFNASAATFAFCTYFCMYAFRKPFAAAGYEGDALLGLEPKTLFVISQVVGYTISKYVGIRVVSEASRGARLRLLLALIVSAELALVLFAVVPLSLKPLALALNGLPLGMVWGLVVRYLEGRRTSEFLLAGLSCSFIVASGIVKDVGRWLLGLGIDQFWMPAAVGLLFLPPFVICSRLLDGIAEPDARDEAERAARSAMPIRERRDFMQRYLPGMLTLLVTYFVLTAFRDFRDNYGAELIAELGYADATAAFTRTEIPVAVLVLIVMAGLGTFRQRLSGLLAVFGVMFAGLGLVGVATMGLDAGVVGPELWMIAIGLGAYLAYVPFSSFLFDRIMAATRHAGTAVFAVNVADAIGYTGSVGLLLYKDLFAQDATRLGFFKFVTYGLSIGGCAALALSAVYFYRRSMLSPAPATSS
jgi:hypothetical protein